MSTSRTLLALAGLGLAILPATAQDAGPPATRAPVAPAQRSTDLRLTGEAEKARRLTDERLRRRDAAARRSLQGVCKGC